MSRRASKTIPLTNSEQTATIDAEDHDLVSRFEWRLSDDGYAVTDIVTCEVVMSHLVLLNDGRAVVALVPGSRSELLPVPNQLCLN